MGKRSSKKQTSGFSLIEVLMAMLVLAIGLLGLAVMTIVVQRSNRFADRLAQAKEVATEALETLRNSNFTFGEAALLGDQGGSTVQAQNCSRLSAIPSENPDDPPPAAFFQGDRIPAQLMPVDYTRTDIVVKTVCPGPPEFDNSRFFWHDGKFLQPARSIWRVASDTPMFTTSGLSLTPTTTRINQVLPAFQNPTWPFFVYYFVVDTAPDSVNITRKTITVVVMWYSTKAKRIEYISMNTQKSQ